LKISEAAGVHPVDDIAREALKRLPVRPGDAVLDLGCGTGVYGLATRLLGAETVRMTDLDPKAIRCARANSRQNKLDGVSFCVGDFFSRLGGLRFDLIIANLPQTPGPVPFLLSKWGGLDGTAHLRRLFREAPRHLMPRGRLFFLLLDLADSRRITDLASRRFTLQVVHRMRREFEPEEYDHYHPGLFAYLDKLRERGISRFYGRGRRRWFHLRFVVARLRPR